MRTPHGLCARFGPPEMLDLAFGDEVPHRTGNILDRHRRIDPVLIEQVDMIGAQEFVGILEQETEVAPSALDMDFAGRLGNIESQPRLRVGVAR